ncbi:hypothetical protein YQE_09916, partial [Dendroctonus ponderosae]
MSNSKCICAFQDSGAKRPEWEPPLRIAVTEKNRHVIMQYLVDKYAKDDSLYPKDLKKRAIVNLRLFFDACYLFPKFGAYH